MLKSNIIYHPYTSLEEQEKAEKITQMEIEKMNSERKEIISEIDKCTKEFKDKNLKFKSYEITV